MLHPAKTPEAAERRVRVYEAVHRAGIADREALAEMTGLHPVTVWRHLRALEADDLVFHIRAEYGAAHLWSLP